MRNRGFELARILDLSTHVAPENAIPPTNRRAVVLPGIIENARGPVDKTESGSHARPQRCGVRQSVIYDVFQLLEFLAQRPFFRTRVKLVVTAESRPCSFSPLASRGGRPSSVMAERTAEQ